MDNFHYAVSELIAMHILIAVDALPLVEELQAKIARLKYLRLNAANEFDHHELDRLNLECLKLDGKIQKIINSHSNRLASYGNTNLVRYLPAALETFVPKCAIHNGRMVKKSLACWECPSCKANSTVSTQVPVNTISEGYTNGDLNPECR
jgi:hypothetical protein